MPDISSYSASISTGLSYIHSTSLLDTHRPRPTRIGSSGVEGAVDIGAATSGSQCMSKTAKISLIHKRLDTYVHLQTITAKSSGAPIAEISTQQGLPERFCGDRSFVRLGSHTEKHVPDHQCSLPSLSCMSRDLANRGWTLRLPCLKNFW
jgi:hypothetical protein